MDNFFSAPADDTPKAARRILAVSSPAVNGIALHLSAAAGQEIEARAPVIFEDDEGVSDFSKEEYAAIYGERLTGEEITALRELVCNEVAEKYRRNLLIARECGPSDGNLMQLYLVACQAEGIDPLREIVAL